MKAVIVFIYVFCSSLSSYGQSTGVDYFIGNHEQALLESHKENKPLLIKAYTDWCGYCKKLNKTTLSDPTIIKLLNTRFIVMQQNMERGAGTRIKSLYGIRGYPTIVVVSPSGEVFQNIVGYRNPTELENELLKILGVEVP